MWSLILVSLFGGALACQLDGQTYGPGQEWTAELRDHKSGRIESFKFRCSASNHLVMTGCLDVDTDTFVPYRSARVVQLDENTESHLTCGSQRYGFGFFLKRVVRDRPMCLDAEGNQRMDGEEWLNEARSVKVTCSILPSGGWKVLDIACYHPIAGDIAPGRGLRKRGGGGLRCLQYRGAGGVQLRLAERMPRRRTEQGLKRQAPEMTETISMSFLGERAALSSLGSSACFDGVPYDVGAVWDSPDGTLRKRCLKVGDSAEAVVDACLTPDGNEILKGASRLESRRLYSCRYSLDGNVIYLDVSAAPKLAADEAACRKSREERKAVEGRNKEIVKRNKALLRRLTTARDAAEFRTAVNNRRHSFRYKATRYYDVIARRLEPTLPLPKLKCELRACSGGRCWSGSGQTQTRPA